MVAASNSIGQESSDRPERISELNPTRIVPAGPQLRFMEDAAS